MSTPTANVLSPSPGTKVYNPPGVANLPYHQRPLPPGWLSQFDPVHQAYFYINENINPPTVTWEDPRPAYYMAQERGQYAPPPGIQGSSPRPQQAQQQQQFQTTVQNQDGSVTTITSNGQPIHVSQSTPQPQQQQQRSSGPSVGKTILGAAVVSSVLRPRPRVVVAPRRRC